MRLQLLLELVGGLEGREGRLERIVRIAEPMVDEGVERLLLAQPLGDLVLAAQADLGIARLAVDEQVGRPALAVGALGVLELPLRARLIGGAVVAVELVGRQARAQARPEDRDDDVGLRWRDDLLLEVPRGAQGQVFPEDRLELDGGCELALEPLQDPHGEEPLETDVAGGREKDTERKRGHDSRPTDERSR